jgi:hypothetical protein
VILVLVLAVTAGGLLGGPFGEFLATMTGAIGGAGSGGLAGAAGAPGAVGAAGAGGATAAAGAAGGAAPFFSGLFAPDRIGDALLPLVGGAVVAGLVVSSPGRRISHRVSAFAPQLRTVLMFFVVGLVLFAVVPLIG